MLIFGPSSVAHTVSASGVPTVAVYFAAMRVRRARERPAVGANFNTGGVFLFAASLVRLDDVVGLACAA